MKQILHDPEVPVKVGRCDQCDGPIVTQSYDVTRRRDRITLEWRFCSLDCLRVWAEPKRGWLTWAKKRGSAAS